MRRVPKEHNFGMNRPVLRNRSVLLCSSHTLMRYFVMTVYTRHTCQILTDVQAGESATHKQKNAQMGAVLPYDQHSTRYKVFRPVFTDVAKRPYITGAFIFQSVRYLIVSQFLFQAVHISRRASQGQSATCPPRTATPEWNGIGERSRTALSADLRDI